MVYAAAMKTHLHNLIATRLTRRGILKATSGVTATALLGVSRPIGASGGDDLGFAEVRQGYDGEVHWPAETHDCDLVLSWGDPIFPNAPAWEEGKTTEAAQALQFGDSCDFIAYMPLPFGTQASDHGLLVVNHEFTRSSTMFVGHSDPSDKARAATEMNGHGMSVVEVRRTNTGWAPVLESAFNRRLTVTSDFTISGPAAGHRRLQTEADPKAAM